MKRIIKSFGPLYAEQVTHLMLPAEAEILSVGEYDGLVFLWAKVEIDALSTPHAFWMAAEYAALPPEIGPCLGAVSLGDNLVFHVFSMPDATP